MDCKGTHFFGNSIYSPIFFRVFPAFCRVFDTFCLSFLQNHMISFICNHPMREISVRYPHCRPARREGTASRSPEHERRVAATRYRRVLQAHAPYGRLGGAEMREASRKEELSEPEKRESERREGAEPKRRKCSTRNATRTTKQGCLPDGKTALRIDGRQLYMRHATAQKSTVAHSGDTERR